MKIYKILFWGAFCVTCFCILQSCGGDKRDVSEEATSRQEIIDNEKPLNISVYLDLSDRLTRKLTPSQAQRDTAIINKIIEKFVNDCVERGKIIHSKNHFQIFFYPTASDNTVSELAKNLNIDLSKANIRDKKKLLLNLRDNHSDQVWKLYSLATQERKWIGSDIWGFFSNKKVDDLCIRKNCRNICVILTDGYVFASNNKIKQGHSYSYILPKSLKDPSSSLIVKRKGLKDLEVLVMEVNPYEPSQGDQIHQILERWFEEMGVKKIKIVDTDLSSNVESIVEDFLE